MKEEKRIGSARVVTTIELSEEQKEKVEQKLMKTTSYAVSYTHLDVYKRQGQ